jgi:hypothetical protein
LPIDIYGAGRAAFCGASLVFAYGVMQSIVSRPLAAVIERYGFGMVCLIFGLLPLTGYILVHFFVQDELGADPIFDQSHIVRPTISTS